MAQTMVEGVEVLGRPTEESSRVLTRGALEFVALLHRQFNPRRRTLLQRRAERQEEFRAGSFPHFLSETEAVRRGDWQVATTPADLQDRRVEITGPVDRKMMINALNSGARAFMADLEDALSPTWHNVIEGQANLQRAVRRTLEFRQPDGKRYRLDRKLATLLVRPRGWHLPEKHVTVDGEPICASLLAARALGRSQRRSLGLYLQRHQEVQPPTGFRAAGPRTGDHERAVPAFLHGTTGAHLPQTRCSCDRWDGRVHS